MLEAEVEEVCAERGGLKWLEIVDTRRSAVRPDLKSEALI